MAEIYSTVLSSPFAQTILLFVLVFVVVFAVLQKSKILGDGKKQIDALVALAIALLFVGVGDEFKTPSGVRIAGGILAFLAVIFAVVYFTGFWNILIGFVYNNSGLVGNIVFIIIISLAVWAAIGFGKDTSDSKGK